MKKFILFTFILYSTFLHAQLHIKLDAIPSNTPLGDNIYIAGNFNNWNPGNAAFKLTLDSDSILGITLTPVSGTLNFKFTRGSWATVEGTAQGNFIPNRTFTYNGQEQTIKLNIAGWEDLGGTTSGSTASPQVSILSENFNIPQINRTRKIWLYLPPDYHTTNKRYPVLYMHDGQNLFDNQTAFAGEWKVDESLDSLFLTGDHGCIIVGIENGGSNRLNEYSPWINSQYGGGQGDAYIRFIVETLKPHIDSLYRTFPDSDHTGLMGSSMGGLISVYGGFRYPEIFGKIGAFSSSFWFSPESYNYVSDTGMEHNLYVYMIAGAKEGSSNQQVADMQKMVAVMSTAGLAENKIIALSHEDGTHSEWYWAREFPSAYLWLFEKKTSTISDRNTERNYRIIFEYPSISLIAESIKNYAIKIHISDLKGNQLLLSDYQTEQKVDMSFLPPGMYIVSFFSKNDRLVSKKVIIAK